MIELTDELTMIHKLGNYAHLYYVIECVVLFCQFADVYLQTVNDCVAYLSTIYSRIYFSDRHSASAIWFRFVLNDLRSLRIQKTVKNVEHFTILHAILV